MSVSACSCLTHASAWDYVHVERWSAPNSLQPRTNLVPWKNFTTSWHRSVTYTLASLPRDAQLYFSQAKVLTVYDNVFFSFHGVTLAQGMNLKHIDSTKKHRRAYFRWSVTSGHLRHWLFQILKHASTYMHIKLKHHTNAVVIWPTGA